MDGRRYWPYVALKNFKVRFGVCQDDLFDEWVIKLKSHKINRNDPVKKTDSILNVIILMTAFLSLNIHNSVFHDYPQGFNFGSLN